MYSLAKAAKAVGKGKPAILKAIQKGRISATKNEMGEWEIDPAELHRVYPPVSQETVSEPISLEPMETVGTTHEPRFLDLEIRFLREKVETLERMKAEERALLSGQVEDLRRERDRLLGVVESQTRLITHMTDQTAKPEPARPNWWRRLTRKD
jgi:hypothetical protein